MQVRTRHALTKEDVKPYTQPQMTLPVEAQTHKIAPYCAVLCCATQLCGYGCSNKLRRTVLCYAVQRNAVAMAVPLLAALPGSWSMRICSIQSSSALHSGSQP